MHRFRAHRWFGIRCLLGMILLVVQLGALTHALAHDLDAPQDQVCLSCLAQPSGNTPINSVWSAPVDPAAASRFEMPAAPTRSITVFFARQRAPPITD